MNTLINYLKDVKDELTHVSWLTKKQVIWFTVIVIVISVLIAFYLGLMDFLLSFLLETFIL
jgi:preprotein translocase subunit SecE